MEASTFGAGLRVGMKSSFAAENKKSDYSTWHLCGPGSQNEAACLQKACKNISKKKKEKACCGDWRLSDLMGGDVVATAGLCVMYGRVQYSTVGPATT